MNAPIRLIEQVYPRVFKLSNIERLVQREASRSKVHRDTNGISRGTYKKQGGLSTTRPKHDTRPSTVHPIKIYFTTYYIKTHLKNNFKVKIDDNGLLVTFGSAIALLYNSNTVPMLGDASSSTG